MSDLFTVALSLPLIFGALSALSLRARLEMGRSRQRRRVLLDNISLKGSWVSLISTRSRRTEVS